MRKTVRWLSVSLVIVVLGVFLPAFAVGRDFSSWWCIEDIERILPPIPVGCEVIDCCPGCPGKDPIDWHILVAGDPVQEVVLKFENLSAAAKKRLRVKGKNATWIDNSQLKVGKGETVLTGFAADVKARPVVAIPRLIMNKAKVKKLASVGVEMPAALKERGQVEFKVEQKIGNVVVNEFSLTPFLRICRWPPPPLLSDKIDIDNNGVNDTAVVLLDAHRSNGCTDDEVLRGNDVINIGNALSNGSCHSEIVVFSDDDAMRLIENPAWTDSLGDVQRADLTPDLLRERATFWIMQGPFATTSARATNDMVRANMLYNTMNCGVGFTTVANNDETQNANTAALLNANCGQAANLHTQIGFTNGHLNVYYLNNPGARGWWCGNNTVIIGAGADNESLAHEFGHAFSLGHTNTIAGIPTTNLMVTGGTGRNSVTEGQCFRCNVNATSTLNSNGARTGTTRNCPDTTTSSACPSLALDVTPE